MTRDTHRRNASRRLENRLCRFGCETLEDRCLLTIDLVEDINQTGAGSDPSFFEVIGPTAYFAATDITSGTELWKTNGTAAGTVLVKDIFTGADGEYPNSSEPRYLTGFGGTLYFSAFDPVRGRELWKSNGTAAGTTLVKDIWQGDQG